MIDSCGTVHFQHWIVYHSGFTTRKFPRKLNSPPYKPSTQCTVILVLTLALRWTPQRKRHRSLETDCYGGPEEPRSRHGNGALNSCRQNQMERPCRRLEHQTVPTGLSVWVIFVPVVRHWWDPVNRHTYNSWPNHHTSYVALQGSTSQHHCP